MPDAVAPADSRAAVDRLLAERVHELEFFQALRLLERAQPQRPRIGTAPRPRDDLVRLGQAPSLAFAAATLAAYTPGGAEQPARLWVNFFGLLGANGPLPIHLTEYARDRLRNSGDRTLAAFLDLFHHRMLSLFYRAWAQAQPALSAERPDDDRFAGYVGALCGLGAPSLRDRDAVPDLAKLHFAGRLAAQPRGAEGLQAILAEYFRVPVRIEPYAGEWLAVPPEARTRLSCRAPHLSANGQLGVSATVGARSWQAQHRFRIVLGPLSRADCERFLPGGPSLPPLAAWVRNYVGLSLDWELQVLIERDEVPALRLGRRGGDAAAPTRLGLTTWLGGRAATRQVDRIRVAPPAIH